MEIKVYKEKFDNNYPFWDGYFDNEDYSEEVFRDKLEDFLAQDDVEIISNNYDIFANIVMQDSRNEIDEAIEKACEVNDKFV